MSTTRSALHTKLLGTAALAALLLTGAPRAFADSLPTAPTNLKGTLSGSGAELTWNASTDDNEVTGYMVYQNGTSLGIAYTTAYSLDGLKAGTTYSYTVKAQDNAGQLSAASNVATLTIQTAATPTPTPTPTASASAKANTGATSTPTATATPVPSSSASLLAATPTPTDEVTAVEVTLEPDTATSNFDTLKLVSLAIMVISGLLFLISGYVLLRTWIRKRRERKRATVVINPVSNL